jgi:hypothetical protein
MKEPTHTEIDTLREEIIQNQERSLEIHSRLKVVEHTRSLSDKEKQSLKKLEKEHRQVDTQEWKLKERFKALTRRRKIGG